MKFVITLEDVTNACKKLDSTSLGQSSQGLDITNSSSLKKLTIRFYKKTNNKDLLKH